MLAERFRQLWGEYAGWAHSVLFTADLRAFKGYQGKEEVKEEGEVKMEEKEEEAQTPIPVPPAAPGAQALDAVEPPAKRKRGGRS